ncbi:MAG: hypothetical protein K8W52_04020 [Deltaproteobacteria bacterium]|nr:hypothetical protein [Deltaproteobacteria bacterium]
MRARILALLLVLVLWPSAAETIEQVAHWARFGGAAHAGDGHAAPCNDDDDDPRGCTEHGCTPTFHVCGCHGTPMNTAGVAVAVPRPTASHRAISAAPLALEGRPAAAPQLRPPIA